MQTKLINIVTALVMILAFFMPWVKYFIFSGSAFDILMEVTNQLKYADDEPGILLVYLLLIFPIFGIIILIFYLQPNLKKDSISMLGILKKIPLIFLVLSLLYGFIKMGDDVKMLADSEILNVLGIGFYLTIISSLILFFSPATIEEISNKKDNNDENVVNKNTDDLFE